MPVQAATGGRRTFGITDVRVHGFRSARDVSFAPGAMCALVGEASAGKSNLLAAIRAVVDPAAAPLTPDDAARGGDGQVSIGVTFADGARASLQGRPGEAAVSGGAAPPPTLFLPAEARTGAVIAGDAPPPAEIFERAVADGNRTRGSRAWSVLEGFEACCSAGLSGVLFLIEEPELHLRPQAQRYLYRRLRELALAGNQVIYSTHSPSLLNVGRLDEVVFVERRPGTGTRALQPQSVTADEDFRVMTEFDTARNELFLARAAVLVEGWTEKLVLPFVFGSLGHDVDRDGISIVECGGKPNLPLFARICSAAGVPFVVLHDSDRKSSGRFVAAERALNELIAETAGAERVIVLDPDLEAIAGLEGDRRKPERAWREFAGRAPDEMPAQLVRLAELVVELASSAPEGGPPAGGG